MKRKLWIILSLLLIVTMAACNGQQASEPPEEEVIEAQPSEEAELPAPETSGPVQPAECKVVGLFNFPEEPESTSFPPVTEEDWVFGDFDAPVTVMEYSEFQCPYCAQLEPVLVQLQNTYPEDVRLVFRHFPLNIHDKANLGAMAAEAAGLQEKSLFFDMKNFIFGEQATWSQMSVAEYQEWLIEEAAAELKLDKEQFTADLENPELIMKIDGIASGGIAAGVNYTPYVLIEGFVYEGQRDVDTMYAMVQAIEAAKEEYGDDVLEKLPPTTLTGPESITSLIESYEKLVADYDGELIANLPDSFWQDSENLQDNLAYYLSLVEEYGQDWVDSVPGGIWGDMANVRDNIGYYIQLVEDYGQDFVSEIPTVFFSEAAYMQEYVNLYIQLSESLADKIYDSCPPQVVDTSKEYTATIQTEKGDVVVELYADKAPTTVNSFVFLAQEGWFDNITFHRVLPGFVAQSGDPSGLGLGGPGYEFGVEINGLQFDKAGVLGMANSGPDANGSQFFITYDAVPQLDGGYTVFGQVVEGMDVLEELSPRDPSQGDDLPPGDMINTITIEEN